MMDIEDASILTILWTGYFLAHSLLASDGVKRKIKEAVFALIVGIASR